MIRYLILDQEKTILGEGSCVAEDLHLKGNEKQTIVEIDQELIVVRGQKYIDGKVVDGEPDSAKLMIKLRRHRLELLNGSDWTQLSDVPSEIREKWKAYRQELRDLPSKYKNLTSFEDIIWPSQPQ